ncbi:MAG: 3-oxoacyl-ACP synthase [Nitrospirae bacterium RBG_19FT_COMBO_58_9]|nr:MAG: 3-oxoacyl-ACP synthase [Nitrospirae bacterium RBG_19FT_COMBO_58_9]
MIRTKIMGTGSYLPERVVSNREVGASLGIEPEVVARLTGIQERRWASSSQASSDLAVEAARQALETAGLPVSELGAIVLSTTSPDSIFPSTACHVQRMLGCSAIPAFDMAASCSGFLYGLSMGDAMIRSGQIKTCLVVAAEVKSRSIDPADGDTVLLFGDGAGAVVLRGEPEAVLPGRGLLGVRLHADGSQHGLITIPAGGSRRPTTSETLEAKSHTLRMQGAPLFRLAVRRLEQAILEIVKEFGVDVQNIAQLVLHQANGRILAQLTRRLGVSPERVCSVIGRYGNTSSASLPIALDYAVRSGGIRPNDLVLLGSFGGGVTWATGLIRW